MLIFSNKRVHNARRMVAVLAGGISLIAAQSASAQDTSEAAAKAKSHYGENLSAREAATLLREMRQLTEEALAASRSAEQAGSVAEVKAGADKVLQLVWGLPSGISGEGTGEVPVHGWKTRWQVTGAEFDPDFVKRYGTQAPPVTDPRELGLVGRARAVRGYLKLQHEAGKSQPGAEAVLASLNNVVGWTYLTVGYKGTEGQPRISLTHVWDAPVEFWNSSADTGWLHEVYSQAVNILKTDYAGDAAEARQHAAGMSELLVKVLRGEDADKNGVVEAKMMEGGLNAALAEASQAGLQAN